MRTGSSSGHFSVSQSGQLAISHEATAASFALQEVDRRGTRVGSPLAAGRLANPRVSPEGRRLLYESIGAASGGDIHVLDLDRTTDTPLTFTQNRARTPVWSPDGRRFACVVTNRSNATHLLLGSADGLGAPDSIPLPAGMSVSLTDWSSTGSRLVFFTADFYGRTIQLEAAARAVRAIGDSLTRAVQQRISLDGRWLAYVTGSSPSNVNVFVTSLEGPAGRWQISTSLAAEPRWTQGGRELVYRGLDGRMMAVEIDTRDGFRPGPPKPLFTMPTTSLDPNASTWDVDASGERFFLLFPEPRTQSTASIEVVTDFSSLVNRK